MGAAENVCLKYYHGGLFRADKNQNLCYVGGGCRTFEVEIDELCGFDIANLGKKSGNYEHIEGVFYLIPGMSLREGLVKVFDDAEVMRLAELARAYRCIEMYVQHQFEAPIILQSQESVASPTQQQQPKKLTPKRKPNNIPVQISTRKSPRFKESAAESDSTCYIPNTSNTTLHPEPSKPCSPLASIPLQPSVPDSEIPRSVFPETETETPKTQPDVVTTLVPDDYEWVDPRPNSPLPLQDLIGPEYSTEEADTDFIPENESQSSDEEILHLEKELSLGANEEDGEGDNDDAYDDETSDDEYHVAREKVKGFNEDILKVAQKLQKDAETCGLPSQIESGEQQTTVNEVEEGFHSDYNSEEEYDTPIEESGDEVTAEKGRSRRDLLIGAHTDYSTFKWKVGQRFTTRVDFKEAVSKYGVLQGRNVGILISNKSRQQRIGVNCEKGCPFRLYSSWDSRRAVYVVKTVVGEHTCVRNMERNKQLTTSWMARQLLEVFKARPHWPANEIIDCIKIGYRVNVKRGFAYKCKYKAHKLLHGSMSDHYNKVGRYIEALKGASPGTDVQLHAYQEKGISKPIFQRLYICFDAVAKGWVEGCRKVICVDSCFLKTFLGGQLISAVGRDGNDQMFPIAWAVVEGENNDSWSWFFKQLQSSLGLADGEGIVLISDEHKAIIHGVKSLFPKAEHRHCARHIFALWHSVFKGEQMKQQFWKIAKAYNCVDYTEALEELREIDDSAATAFLSYNPKVFCRAFMSTSTKADVITNNMAETWNGYIITARNKHLLYMLEEIRAAVMKRLVDKQQEMEKVNSSVCPRIQKKLEKNKEDAAKCTVIPSSSTVFQVNHMLDSLTVDLTARSCTCREWDMCGYPCKHGAAAIFFCHKNAEDYVDDYYKKETYLKSYSGAIPPINGEKHWPKIDMPLHPPPIKVGPGRPRSSRIKAPHENPKKAGKLTKHGVEMTCSKCNSKGHNKRGCHIEDTDAATTSEPAPKRPRGRPRLSSTAVAARIEQHVPLSQQHHDTTVQPQRLGRNGRVIHTRGGGGRGNRGGGGRGNRGGGRTGSSSGRRGSIDASSSGSMGGGRIGSRGGRRGRGRGRNNIPTGHGVLFGPDGAVMTNDPGSSGPTILST